MQAAGMLRGTRAICLLVLLVPLIGISHSLPLQLLPSIPGYIPVYIRNGDQPLEEINPALAEAFHETSSLSKSIRLDNAPGQVEVNPVENEANTSVGNPKEKTNYPVHVRQVESGGEEQGRVKDDEDEEKKRTDNNLHVTDVPKLHSDPELDGDEKAKQGPNSKMPEMKTSEPAPSTKEEREEFGIQTGKEEKPQYSHEQNPNFPELPAEAPQHHDETVPGFLANKLRTTSTESVTQSSVHLNKDELQVIDQKDAPTSTTSKEEEPANQENQSEVMTKDSKLSPLSMPDSTDDQTSPTSKEKIVEEDKSRDLTEENGDVPSF